MDSILRERVAAHLAKTGKTKGELANELGMSRASLHQKLNGVYDFKLSEAETLAALMGCSVDELRVPLGSAPQTN